MLYNSCVIKYSKYRAYGANLGEYFYLHIVHFNSCVVCGYNCFIYYLLDIEKIIISAATQLADIV